MPEETKTETTSTPTQDPKPEPKYTQQDLDGMAARIRKSTEEKYADYSELKKFRETHQKTQDESEQRRLEEQGKYDEAKKKYESDIEQLKALNQEKDSMINSERIGNALTMEVLRQNAYPETISLLKQNAVFEDGKVLIKGKDSNGMEVNLPIEEGVKQFLGDKPYLVKAAGKGGAGTASGEVAGSHTQNLSDADELEKAIQSGDRKRVHELKTKIRAKQGMAGIVNIKS